MPMQKARLHRLMRIVALLKENRFPNSETLVKEFRRLAVEEDLEIDCGKKTVLRDMKILKDEFHCPLAFDRARNGYYLKHHGWDFVSPALLDENEMLAAVIGARISEDIFPSPLKNRIRNAVDQLLRTNNPDFLDTADMGSISILSRLYNTIDPDIFMTVFRGWQSRRCVKISYADYKSELSWRVIEPHTLVFFHNSWYTKAFCHRKNEPRTFALQRIKSAELLPGAFEPDRNIIDSVNTDEFFGFRKVENVRLKADAHALDSLRAAPLHSRQRIFPDGTVEIPETAKELLFPFLLSLGGGAVLLEPAALRDKFRAELAEMLKKY